MKYFVFSDPHGNYEALLTALSSQGYESTNPKHQLVGLGDYFGRAAQTNADCVNIWNYLTSSIHKNKPICLRGNHESIILNAIYRRGLTELDFRNGEDNTFASFANVFPAQIRYDYQRQFEACKEMLNCGFAYWIEGLPWYFETKHYIFTHGFLPRTFFMADCPLSQYTAEDWYRASWSKVPEEIIRLPDKRKGKTIVFGHWRAKQLNEMFLCKWEPEDGEIYNDPARKLIGLDITTVLSQKVGCIVLEDKPNA